MLRRASILVMLLVLACMACGTAPAATSDSSGDAVVYSGDESMVSADADQAVDEPGEEPGPGSDLAEDNSAPPAGGVAATGHLIEHSQHKPDS